jgi:hypothetical protein
MLSTMFDYLNAIGSGIIELFTDLRDAVNGAFNSDELFNNPIFDFFSNLVNEVINTEHSITQSFTTIANMIVTAFEAIMTYGFIKWLILLGSNVLNIAGFVTGLILKFEGLNTTMGDSVTTWEAVNRYLDLFNMGIDNAKIYVSYFIKTIQSLGIWVQKVFNSLSHWASKVSLKIQLLLQKAQALLSFGNASDVAEKNVSAIENEIKALEKKGSLEDAQFDRRIGKLRIENIQNVQKLNTMKDYNKALQGTALTLRSLSKDTQIFRDLKIESKLDNATTNDIFNSLN